MESFILEMTKKKKKPELTEPPKNKTDSLN